MKPPFNKRTAGPRAHGLWQTALGRARFLCTISTAWAALSLLLCGCGKNSRPSKEHTSVSPVPPAEGKVIDQEAVYPEQPKVIMKKAPAE